MSRSSFSSKTGSASPSDPALADSPADLAKSEALSDLGKSKAPADYVKKTTATGDPVKLGGNPVIELGPIGKFCIRLMLGGPLVKGVLSVLLLALYYMNDHMLEDGKLKIIMETEKAMRILKKCDMILRVLEEDLRRLENNA